MDNAVEHKAVVRIHSDNHAALEHVHRQTRAVHEQRNAQRLQVTAAWLFSSRLSTMTAAALRM